jgi:hypothetical protein
MYVTAFREGMDDARMQEVFRKVRQIASQSSFSDWRLFSVLDAR